MTITTTTTRLRILALLTTRLRRRKSLRPRLKRRRRRRRRKKSPKRAGSRGWERVVTMTRPSRCRLSLARRWVSFMTQCSSAMWIKTLLRRTWSLWLQRRHHLPHHTQACLSPLCHRLPRSTPVVLLLAVLSLVAHPRLIVGLDRRRPHRPFQVARPQPKTLLEARLRSPSRAVLTIFLQLPPPLAVNPRAATRETAMSTSWPNNSKSKIKVRRNKDKANNQTSLVSFCGIVLSGFVIC